MTRKMAMRRFIARFGKNSGFVRIWGFNEVAPPDGCEIVSRRRAEASRFGPLHQRATAALVEDGGDDAETALQRGPDPTLVSPNAK